MYLPLFRSQKRIIYFWGVHYHLAMLHRPKLLGYTIHRQVYVTVVVHAHMSSFCSPFSSLFTQLAISKMVTPYEPGAAQGEFLYATCLLRVRPLVSVKCLEFYVSVLIWVWKQARDCQKVKTIFNKQKTRRCEVSKWSVVCRRTVGQIRRVWRCVCWRMLKSVQKKTVRKVQVRLFHEVEKMESLGRNETPTQRESSLTTLPFRWQMIRWVVLVIERQWFIKPFDRWSAAGVTVTVYNCGNVGQLHLLERK